MSDTLGLSTSAIPTSSPQLATDPAYLAFMRELGFNDAEDQATTQDSVDSLTMKRDRYLPRIARQGGYEREHITGGYEDRGLLRSGEHEVALARQREHEGEVTSDLTNDTALGVADLEKALARRRLARQRQGAEAGLTAAGNVVLNG